MLKSKMRIQKPDRKYLPHLKFCGLADGIYKGNNLRERRLILKVTKFQLRPPKRLRTVVKNIFGGGGHHAPHV